ncbi:putative PHD and RING finger domain-containing protein 1 [Cocos nucifera]|uniref:Putative PHD and RING finger domain-containing protein 1 n=1 Tax=Cocos nucifera TaxID=13894 RepID=A0A8K0HVV0_COCNU|nr:putative PHD and RING finger domain-containing protein 1 [Cocos nucifera]
MTDVSELRASPVKRLKTLAPSPALAPGSKGKEKMAEEPAAVEGSAVLAAEEEKICGICLSDGGRSIRGRIDSCDHYFCFICIMEWAKVESRCPMCKQRFRFIRRPPVPGIFPSERVVEAPVRDQVYHPLGNEGTGISDPYANVSCSACHSSADEELLLLCDLCDSAAHSYCIGLGATVPEGGWYCPDCSTSRDEHLKSQSDTDSYNQDSYKITRAVQVFEPPVSIFEIVADERTSYSSLIFSTIQVPEQQRNNGSSSSRHTSCRISHGFVSNTERSSSPIAPAGETVSPTQAKRVEQAARTLRGYRNLHSRIRVLRENWNALRAGSLAFSSNLLGYGAKINEREQNNGRSESDLSGRPEPSDPVNSGQIANANASSKTRNSGCSSDIKKAWKMLEVAKSEHGTQISDKYHSLNSFSNRYASKVAEDLHCGFLVSKGRNTAHMVAGRAVSEDNKNFSPKVLYHFFIPQHQDKQIPEMQNTEVQHVRRGDMNTHLLGYVGLSSGKQDRLVHQDGMCDGKSRPASQQAMHEVSVPFDTRETPVCSGSFACSPSGASILSFNKPGEFSSCMEPHVRKQGLVMDSGESLSRKFDMVNSNVKGKVESVVKLNKKLLIKDQHVGNGKLGAGTFADKRSSRRNDNANNNAKSDIQSLVKLNLKLLSKDQHLGADKFKEVARAATHTILAACGLEHSKSNARIVSSSICQHNGQIKQMRQSNHMPNSCRECFYTFVQHVVKSILSEEHILPTAAKFS